MVFMELLVHRACIGRQGNVSRSSFFGQTKKVEANLLPKIKSSLISSSNYLVVTKKVFIFP